MKCPVHGQRLVHKKTTYGGRWHCTVEGCDITWSGRKNTTPADVTLRRARIAAHDAFDALWKPPTKIMTRPQAYEWLQEILDMKPEEAHIGLFTRQECEVVVLAVQKYRKKCHAFKCHADNKRSRSD